MRLDLVAVAPHPDDSEIGCGGTLALAARHGYRVGIIDLTDGEPTPLNDTPEVRLAEARRAAEILGIHVREVLDLDNRRLFDTFEARIALARLFRKYRPRVVISMGGRTVMASPDHYQAQLICEAAVFYSRLTRWEEYFHPYPPHSVERMVYWPVRSDPGGDLPRHAFVVDITETYQTKVAAVRAYRSQFPPGKDRIFAHIEGAARFYGVRSGCTCGELFLSDRYLRFDDVMDLLGGAGGEGEYPRRSAPG